MTLVKNSFITTILFACLYALVASYEIGDPTTYGTSFTDFFMIGLLFSGPVILFGAFLTDGLPRLLFRSSVSFIQRIILNQAGALFASVGLYLLMQPNPFSFYFVLFCSGVALIYLIVSESARKYPRWIPYISGWLCRTVFSFFLFLNLFGSMTMTVPFLSYTVQLVNEHLDVVVLVFVSGIVIADVLLSIRFAKRSLPFKTHLLVHQGTVFMFAGVSVLFSLFPVPVFIGNAFAAFLYVMITHLFIIMKTGKEEHHDPSVISTSDD
ncbi:hypothetical protein ADM98_09240 [Exiguobacterium sp. BMC-KP]|uniref:hypothetical protein n=1 Tax=Exiguobacterium sp. BMC-KP TaxID=1684312 RepID=UPI0006AA34DB|nr:hypothetical protein [Exiguobacterium sp. BMC-KP]KOP29086.1 hypothetical protein ADM98_09240 [Exiguobacterium sp. BMC-KP]